MHTDGRSKRCSSYWLPALCRKAQFARILVETVERDDSEAAGDRARQ
jgi:hypothetical protein